MSFCMTVCVCIHVCASDCGGQNRFSSPQKIVSGGCESYCAGAENQSLIFLTAEPSLTSHKLFYYKHFNLH